MIYASFRKLFKELKNGIRILSTPTGSWIIDLNIILNILIYNLKTAWPT